MRKEEKGKREERGFSHRVNMASLGFLGERLRFLFRGTPERLYSDEVTFISTIGKNIEPEVKKGENVLRMHE